VKVGHQITALKLYACQRIYAFAMTVRRQFFFTDNKIDVILTHTTPMTALESPAGSDVLGFSDNAMFINIIKYLWPTDLMGFPSIVIPIGVDTAGLPISIQVICLHWHEADCLSVAQDIESLYLSQRPQHPIYLDLLSPS